MATNTQIMTRNLNLIFKFSFVICELDFHFEFTAYNFKICNSNSNPLFILYKSHFYNI